ncbi:MAG: flagellar hook basal-body protein [Faecalibacterium sp.]|jgi:flagellar basal-body rod protein FlgG|nr:flagellar hook basal-body protein [Faecalibacterium sp.]
MKAAFYAGTTGLIAQQNAIDAVGNNLANMTTVGYKPEEVSFRSLLYNHMYANTDDKPLTGYGVKEISTGVDFTAGQYQATGGALDFAIQGDALFAIQNGGKTEYTRDGQFGISVENGGSYLVTATGAYVLDKNLQKIQVPYLNTTTIDTDTLRDQLGLFTFRNPSALAPNSSNSFTATAQSGPATAAAGATNTVLSRYLEGSGTSMVDEMTDMIQAQRCYQMCAKVLQTADEDEQTINSLRK